MKTDMKLLTLMLKELIEMRNFAVPMLFQIWNGFVQIIV